MDVSENGLSGTLPSEFGLLTTLQKVRLFARGMERRHIEVVCSDLRVSVSSTDIAQVESNWWYHTNGIKYNVQLGYVELDGAILSRLLFSSPFFQLWLARYS